MGGFLRLLFFGAAAIGAVLLVATLGAALSACAPPPLQSFNSPIFALRPPAPGRPGYFETIKYIDDGLRYVDPRSAFFISPDGRMCFRGALHINRTIFAPYDSDWCLSPVAVSEVEMVQDPSIGAPQLVLSCKHSVPQCVREIEYLRRPADTLTVQIVPSDQERAAVEHLIYLMGGNLGDHEPFPRHAAAMLVPRAGFGTAGENLLSPP